MIMVRATAVSDPWPSPFSPVHTQISSVGPKMVRANPPPVISATTVLMTLWSLKRVAKAGANSEPSICKTMDTDTISPAVPPSIPRSRRIGAIHAKTLNDIIACSTMKSVTCQATAERHTFAPPWIAWCFTDGCRIASGRKSRSTTAAGTAQNHSADVQWPVAVKTGYVKPAPSAAEAQIAVV